MNKTRFVVQRDPWANKVGFGYHVSNPGGRISVATDVVFTELAEGVRGGPFLEVEAHEAQQLLDELWAAGIRPSQEFGSTGQIGAVQRHLDDMRAIAFHAIQAPKP